MTREHYDRLLAPIYLWMVGGRDAALAQGAAEVAALGPPRTPAAVAVDLGAGFGMHAIPLARAGWRVTAIDRSPHLLAHLRREARDPRLVVVEGDLLDFREHAPERAELILCMGDTLTHLADRASLSRLLADVAAALRPGGRFVATFRDYATPPAGDARFIPVRSDADRILTCFLEEAGERMLVHDLVHERAADGWTMRVGRYAKLRLAPEEVRAALLGLGLSVALEAGPRGMVRVVAGKDGDRGGAAAHAAPDFAALARRPRCLLADEPLRGIAPIDQELLCDILRAVAAEGCAVVVTGHEAPTLLALAHHVTWCTAGTTYELGAPADALRHEAFGREYGLAIPRGLRLPRPAGD